MSENESMTTPEATDAPATEGAVLGKGKSIKLDSGRGGMFGVKAGMTQVYDDDGMLSAVTVIDLRPNVVTQVKTIAKEGYNALQVGVLEKKAKNLNKPDLVTSRSRSPKAVSTSRKNSAFMKP